MNILFVANLVPYPLDGGGKIKTFTTIQALSKKNTVDLVCFYEKENVEEAKKALKQYCCNIVLLPIKVTTSENYKYILKKAIKSLFSSYSLSVYKYHNDEMKSEIQKLVRENEYGLVYFNILQVYSYKKDIVTLKPNMKFLLDTQNCETQIFRRYEKESSNLLKKIYLKLECHKLKKFEAWAIHDTDSVIVLSNADKKQLEELDGLALDCVIIPIGVNEPSNKKKIKDKSNVTNILFLGTLTWVPNNKGMIWFLKNVMPLLQEKKENIHLYIVGKNPSSQLLSIAEQYRNVTITGYVESVDHWYDKCDFMIVPLFIGSGQRVKIIEAFSRGMPVLSTSIGAEGLNYTDGVDIMIADTAEAFSEKITTISEPDICNTLSMNSRKLYNKYYSVEAVSRQINAVVDSLRTE
ncbi:MAG: glycosyltransferase family 4 protein [Desulfosporosinus sp.]|nr:glycosyltransferase family 4 protein [Desulfosporosinus sp.]